MDEEDDKAPVKIDTQVRNSTQGLEQSAAGREFRKVGRGHIVTPSMPNQGGAGRS